MQKRITIFDTVRGFTMISMAGFHACYDLAYLYGWDMLNNIYNCSCSLFY